MFYLHQNHLDPEVGVEYLSDNISGPIPRHNGSLMVFKIEDLFPHMIRIVRRMERDTEIAWPHVGGTSICGKLCN